MSMDRIITVKGSAKLSLRPDQVIVSMTLTSEDRDYDAAMEQANDRLEALRDALSAEGFDRADLKTTNFRVSTEYDFHNDQHGNGRRVFRGYACTHELKLSLDFDAARLGRTLSAITGCEANPDLNVRFTVKDSEAVSDELLRQAADSALRRARVLADASGVTLGALVRIHYSWGGRDFFSPTEFAAGGMLRSAKASLDFTPDSIEISDDATFVWEIM